MDLMHVRGLLMETKAILDLYESKGADTHRVDAQDKVTQLVRALERPKDAILKLPFSPTILMAAKVAHDLDIFTSLSQAFEPVPLAKPGTAKSADPLLIERIMKLLAASGFVRESAPCEYLPTELSEEMCQRTSAGVLESVFLEVLPAVQRTPEFLRATNYRNPDDPTSGPLQYTHNVNTDSFTWLCQNPDALARFNCFMEGQRANRPHWGDWFPVRERILNHPELNADKSLLVDIGGGRGHDLVGFRDRFPDATGNLILERMFETVD